jgi:glyoxylase-like metal-dependent hydrolase (beta-lactamase superfamily II)
MDKLSPQEQSGISRDNLRSDGKLCWETHVSALFEANTYLVWQSGRTDCLIIDPSFDPEGIISLIRRKGLKPCAILITHGHVDHIAGNARIKEEWPEIPLIVGIGDSDKLTDARRNLSAAFGYPVVSPAADQTIVDGDQLELAGVKLLARQIPGHSFGHMVFICKDNAPPVVFVGDVIFAGSIGRTDFPDGNYRQLLQGIRRVLFALPEETILLPGHGPPTTVGDEKVSNPYVASGEV